MLLELIVTAAVGAVNLDPGREVRDRIGKGEVRVFSFIAFSDRFVTGVVAQGETDLTVSVLDPNGTLVGTYDGRKRGPERVSFGGAGVLASIESKSGPSRLLFAGRFSASASRQAV